MFDKRPDNSPATPEWDRRSVRIDHAVSQEAIAASLRRAFKAGHTRVDADRDFEDLLSRLV